MSDMIAEFISMALQEGGGVTELSRKEIADRFECVPSQINYVIETRFSPQNGYLVQSRRGGGGYIRIVRRMDEREQQLLSVAREVPEDLSYPQAVTLAGAMLQAGALSRREVDLLLGACGDQALRLLEEDDRNRLRAEIFRGGLSGLIG